MSSFSISFLSYFFPSFDVVVDMSFVAISLFCFCVGCVLAANFYASSCFDSIALALAKVTVVEGKKKLALSCIIIIMRRKVL